MRINRHCQSGMSCLGLIAGLLFVMGSSSAGADDKPPASAAKPTPLSAPATKPDAKPPTDEECAQWAKALEQAVASGDAAKFDELLDIDALLETATAVPGNPPEVRTIRSEFIAGFKETTQSSPGGLYRGVFDAAKEGGSYRYLRTRLVEGQPRVLVRLVLGNGALNYHEFILSRRPDGRIRAVDVHIFLLGEKFSHTARRGFLPLLEGRSRGIVERLLGRGQENEYVKHWKDTLRLVQEVQKGRHVQALEIYKRLPESVQKDKTVLMLRIRAAQAIDETVYLAALDDYHKQFPNDPSLDLLSIDSFVLKKSFDKALEGVDRLDKSVGGDPYLKILRANLFLAQGKRDQARDMSKQALAEDATLIYAYWTLVTVSMQERKFSETVELLNRIEKNFKLEFGDLKSEPAYAEFVKSPEYEAWIKSRAEKGNQKEKK